MAWAGGDMASASKRIRSALLARLRASQEFSAGVEGRILESEPEEFPCAWIGATKLESAVGPNAIDLVATLHIWKRSGGGAAETLVELGRALLKEPPVIEGYMVAGWRTVFSEVRLDEEHYAYRGIVRCRGIVSG